MKLKLNDKEYEFPSTINDVKLKDYMANIGFFNKFFGVMSKIYNKQEEVIDELTDYDYVPVFSYYTGLEENIFEELDWEQFSIIQNHFNSILIKSVLDVPKIIGFMDFRGAESEYGLMDFKYIKMREKADIELYYKDIQQNYHKILAILFRPIIKKHEDGNYEIEPYDAQVCLSRADQFLEKPFNLMINVIDFFLNLRIRSQKLMESYSNQVEKTEKEIKL